MDVFDLTARIALDTSEYESGLNGAKKTSSGFAKAAKVGLATVASVTAAVTKLSLDAYSSYEQLAGGVEKIFGNMDVSRIFVDASNAYKDLNMSANQYLAVINDVGASFSATMGDAKGYETAKTGLQAISDYASGTGKNLNELSQKFTLITRSTASYQSIADQFSGILPATTEEFLKQAQAAGFLEDSYKTLSDVPIAEYQEAVARMLEKGTEALGLAGNTALEASTTISGSAAMAKAAWENFLVGLADPTQDMTVLTNNLVDSVIAFGENAIPKAVSVLPRLVSSIEDSNQAVGVMITLIEAAGAAMAGMYVGKTVTNLVNGFLKAQEQVYLFAALNGKAAAASAVLNGTLSVSETVVGVLTGKISLATVAQQGWNAAIAANPIGILLAGVAALSVAMVKSYNSTKKLSDELAGQAATSEEAAANVESLKQQIQELNDANRDGKWTYTEGQRMVALKDALAEAEAQYESLYAAEQAAIDGILHSADTVETVPERLKNSLDTFAGDVTALLEAYESTYSSILGSVQGWFGPFEEAKVTVKTSIDEMMAAMASQIEFNQNYEQNLSNLAEVGLGGLASAFQELGPQGAAYAAAIVKALEDAGGATSEGGQEIISNFQNLNENVASSEAALAETMTTMSGEFAAALQSIADTFESNISGMDMADEAKASAANTMAGLLAGLEEGGGPIFAYIDKLLSEWSKLGSLPSVGGGSGGRSQISVGGFATGLDYVPYDNFPAYLHRGKPF